jgi:hypothetical protein
MERRQKDKDKDVNVNVIGPRRVFFSFLKMGALTARSRSRSRSRSKLDLDNVHTFIVSRHQPPASGAYCSFYRCSFRKMNLFLATEGSGREDRLMRR